MPSRKSRKSAKSGGKSTVSMMVRKSSAVTAPVAGGTLTHGPKTQNSQHFVGSELVFCLDPADTGYNVAQLILDPADSTSFPWLSASFKNFDQYRVNSMRFRYVTAQPATAAGQVAMFVDYNIEDWVPSDWASFQSNGGVVVGPLWTNLGLDVDREATHAHGNRKTITLARCAGDPLLTYVGKLVLACDGVVAHSLIQVWCDYDFTAWLPDLPSLVSPERCATEWAHLEKTAAENFVTATREVFVWSKVSQDPICGGKILADDGTGGILLPRGVYYIHVVINGKDTANEQFLVTVGLSSTSGAYPIGYPAKSICGAVGANNELTCNYDEIIYSEGASVTYPGFDGIFVEVTLSGAAGVLTTPAGSCKLFLCAA